MATGVIDTVRWLNRTRRTPADHAERIIGPHTRSVMMLTSNGSILTMNETPGCRTAPALPQQACICGPLRLHWRASLAIMVNSIGFYNVHPYWFPWRDPPRGHDG